MNRILWVALLLVPILAFGFGWWTMRGGLPVQAAQVRQGPIREFIEEQGKTRLPETHLITSPFEGRVLAITLLEGQRVEQGQVVAQIASDDLQIAVAEAQAAVERLDASLVENDDVSVEQSSHEQALKFVESMVSTVAAADARKISGKSRLDYADSNLLRTKEMRRNNAKSQDELELAQLSRVESDVNYQQDVLVAEAFKAMKAATDLVPRMVIEYITRKGLTHHVLVKQKSEAEARLRQTQLRQVRGTMRSPIDGIVLERRISNEQFLAGGTLLLRIGQLDLLEIEAEVLSEDVVRVRPGAPVEIYGPAIGAASGEGVQGIVHRVYPAGFTKISALGVEQQRVTIIIRFSADDLARLRRDRDLGVDYRVRVRIFTATKESAMQVPRSALFRGPDGGWQVFAVRGGRAELSAVTVGLMNDEVVEIQTGLSENDQVVLAPESSLIHGMRVQPLLRTTRE